MKRNFNKCDRCGAGNCPLILSMFNLDMLCLDCKQKEEKHPDYQKACDAEREQVRLGTAGTFVGIGKPADL
jgi:hypothetical protein